MRPAYLLFGNENAEEDDLLLECEIKKYNPEEERSILIGKWGMGKSAILLLQNKNQEKFLKEIDPNLSRLWYLEESSLDIKSLSKLKNQCEYTVFIKLLEDIWKSEICRVYARLISAVRDKLGNDSEHWEYISKATTEKEQIFDKPIWQHIKVILDVSAEIYTKGKVDVAESLDKLRGSDNDIYVSDKTYTAISKCLIDLKGNEFFPSIVIEPIETPTSTIENNGGVAQSLVTALLNVFHKYFQPGRNNFNVRISIPWHRYVVTNTNFPQKLFQYKGFVDWNKKQLKAFIERRIEWEFKRIGRRFNEANVWNSLFEKSMRNKWCSPHVIEDSFDYFLRHSHYRARDILRFTRECVIYYAKQQAIEVDEALKGTIPGVSIKEAFRKIDREITAELLEESNRRFPGLKHTADHLIGMPHPFSMNEFYKRLKNYESKLEVNTIFKNFWDSGVIGIVATPNNNAQSEKFKLFFTDKARRVYTNVENAHPEIWTWFEYNYEGEPYEVLQRLKILECEDYGLVFHPKTIEYFVPNNKRHSCPIGI